MSSDRPIFIIGCARSGTTMLQLMIHSHPRLAMPAETRFLLQLYDKRKRFGDLRNPENADRVADFIIDRRKSRFKDLFLEPEPVRKRIHEAPATMGSAIGAVFEAFAQDNGKQRWGDKRPSYIHHVPKILAMFPDAQIIHIVRDGRDSISSLLSMSWQKGGLNSAIYRWKRAVEVGEDLRKSLPPDQYFEFRYEDVVADAETQLRKLCAFLDEDFDPLMLEYYRVSEVPEWKTWHPNTRQPVNDSSLRRWEKELSAGQIRLVETVLGRHLKSHGYELSTKAWQRMPPPKLFASWKRYESARNKWVEEGNDAERRIAATYEHPVASALTNQQRALAAQQGWLDERVRDQPVGR